jgi:hypothetical protein
MNRRSFFKTLFVGVATAVVAPKMLLAKPEPALKFKHVTYGQKFLFDIDTSKLHPVYPGYIMETCSIHYDFDGRNGTIEGLDYDTSYKLIPVAGGKMEARKWL